jgi:hypothetical protein
LGSDEHLIPEYATPYITCQLGQRIASAAMATITRQPFAPLNEARLQTLTSLKNRQNGKKPSLN